MTENSTGATLHTIGVVTIILGIIAALICGKVFPAVTYDYRDIEETYNWSLAIFGAAASLISGMCLIGFSEMIHLLQGNLIKQHEILNYLEKESAKGKSTSQDSSTSH